MKTLRIALLSMTVCVSAAALAQTPSLLQPPPDAPPPKTNPPGPYAVTVESDPGLPTHTVYRPSDLSAFTGKKRLPIISWGNGACSNAGLLFKNFLTQISSHGYMVISIGAMDTPLPSFATGARPAAGAPRAMVANSKDHELIDAIDWAVKEASRKDSPYYGHLDTSKIAVMGQSCGGLQAIAVSSDPRIKTSVIWNSGVFKEGAAPPGPKISGATKADLQKFHGPVAYFIGGPTDIAYPNAEDDFKQITRVPLFKGNLHVGHGGTYNQPGGGWFGEVGVAWLDWQLKGDQQAAKYFVGKDCTLCTNPIWSVEKKNLR